MNAVVAGQSRTQSALEAVANVLVGYGVAVLANVLVLPAFGYAVTAHDAAAIGLVFTAISLARSYWLRRVFNRLLHTGSRDAHPAPRADEGILWWSVLALIVAVAAFAFAREVRADTESLFVSDFELHCGFGTDAPRQATARVSFLSSPASVYIQPMHRYGDLFGFYFDCDPVHGACVDIVPFPGLSGPGPIVRASRAAYIALRFDTSALDPLRTSGTIRVSTSNQIFSVSDWSISDRCGDFDALSPWLLAHPACRQVLLPKNGSMRWTTVPSFVSCSIGTDPLREWWLNFRVLDCDTAGTCDLMLGT